VSRRVGIEVSLAVAEAVKLARTDVIAAYPITPQTHIVEKLAEIVANGELDAEFIPVESEHSAQSACMGSSAVGARTFTATAGQGLELMHEVMYVAASSRLPIVMTVANRALSGPLSVWGDHSDVMAVRDVGWIQIFAETGQEVYDLVLCAFRIAEDPRVLFPVMVHLDGFQLTHVIEPMFLEDQSDVDRFLPPFHYDLALRPEKPVSMGTFAPPIIYTEIRKSLNEALVSSKEIILETWKEFGKQFERHYSPVESYKADDAEVLLFVMGSLSQTAMIAADSLREKGQKVGVVSLRLWRPFPFEEFRKAVSHVKVMAVLDRCVSLGGPAGPVCSEIRAALYPLEQKPSVVSFIGGLGGRDVLPEHFEYMVERAMEIANNGSQEEYEMIGVRE